MSDAFDCPLSPVPRPANEAERLEALRRYSILDTPAEAAFDRITALAARLFNMPIALVSLVDQSRAWFKSSYGFNRHEVAREATLCSFAILVNEILVVPDTRKDPRFADNPFVQSEPGVRFYAGAPLLTHDGFNLGTLCLLDSRPRTELTADQRATLADLAALVVDELDLRLAARKVAQIDTALLQVSQGVGSATGRAFFQALVQHFTQVLNLDCAYVSLLVDGDPEKLRTIAACARGQIVENFEYLLRDTPCQEVLRQRQICCYPRGVQALFPQAPLLASLEVESYAAIPFFDPTGSPLGLLGIMDRKPLENVHLAESLLTVFALRTAAELERQQTEAARQQAQDELEHLVEQRTAELSEANEQLHLEIGERQQTAAALQKEQEMLRVLLDNVQAGIVACNAEGVLTLFNQAARRFHGVPEQPLPPEQWAEYYDLYRPDGKTRMPKEEIPLFQALQGQTVDNVEMVIAPKQGTVRTLLASGQAITDARGNKQGAVVVMHDITERKQIEAERAQLIREQIARLEAEAKQQQSAFLVDVSTALASSLDYKRTLSSVADLVVPFFADWCAIDLLHSNQSIERVAMAHRDPEKVALGWQLHRQYPPSLDEAAGVPKVLRTRQTEMVAEVPDPTRVSGAEDAQHLRILQELGLKSCIISPLIARGQVLGAISFVMAASDRCYGQVDLALAENIAHQVAIAIDNAYLYQAEQVARSEAVQAAARSADANRVKDEFLAVLSHELRTPLNPILGWAKLLKSRKFDEAKTAQALEIIERNANLQVQLIEDLLDVSRILRGKLSLRVAPVDLQSPIEAAIETVRLAAQAKAIEIETQFQPEVGAVSGDAGRLQQVVWNLLSNAIKFTPKGGKVQVTLEQIDAGVQIQVTDTGQGIPPEFLPHVFESFRQADSTTTRTFGGLGLGLAISRHLIELHGGTIEASSAGEGQGSTFTVKLPLLRNQRCNNQAPSSVCPEPDLAGVQVLVVEDNPDSREFVVFVLEQAGAAVRAAASAAEGREVLQSFRAQVLLCDIGMPVEDGYAFLQSVRALNPQKSGQIPAIALTAYAKEEDRQQALAVGFQEHLAKPVEPTQLLKVIAKLV